MTTSESLRRDLFLGGRRIKGVYGGSWPRGFASFSLLGSPRPQHIFKSVSKFLGSNKVNSLSSWSNVLAIPSHLLSSQALAWFTQAQYLIRIISCSASAHFHSLTNAQVLKSDAAAQPLAPTCIGVRTKVSSQHFWATWPPCLVRRDQLSRWLWLPALFPNSLWRSASWSTKCCSFRRVACSFPATSLHAENINEKVRYRTNAWGAGSFFWVVTAQTSILQSIITNTRTGTLEHYQPFSQRYQHHFFRLAVSSGLRPAPFSIPGIASIFVTLQLQATFVGPLIAHMLGRSRRWVSNLASHISMSTVAQFGFRGRHTSQKDPSVLVKTFLTSDAWQSISVHGWGLRVLSFYGQCPKDLERRPRDWTGCLYSSYRT